MADSECGSSPTDFIRLKTSRHEMPASTRIFVLALATIAQLPRLPDASIETVTPMPASILVNPVDTIVTFWLADTKEHGERESRPPLPRREPKAAPISLASSSR